MGNYKDIQNYLKKKYGWFPKSCYIAHAKEVYGIPVKKAPNRKGETRNWPCPEKRLELIKNAFEHFKMI